MKRTYVVTGAASGIGAATAERLERDGGSVIRCDLHDADVCTDLATADGRRALVSRVRELAGGALDGVVAVAGIGGATPKAVSTNYFGGVATLTGLRPLLAHVTEPRAAVVSSLASIVVADQRIVDACLADDEERAIDTASDACARGEGALLYPSSKAAINRWVRRAAPGPDWAGAGITLNAVAPGVVDTPAARAAVLDDPARAAAVAAAMPQPLCFPGTAEAVGSLLAWLVSAENTLVTGQVIFADGGAEAVLAGAP